jgi:hypothetical protein
MRVGNYEVSWQPFVMIPLFIANFIAFCVTTHLINIVAAFALGLVMIVRWDDYVKLVRNTGSRP